MSNGLTNGTLIKATIPYAASPLVPTANTTYATAVPSASHYAVAAGAAPTAAQSTRIDLYGAPAFVVVLTYNGTYATSLASWDGSVYLLSSSGAVIKSNKATDTTGSFSTVLIEVVPPGSYYVYSQTKFVTVAGTSSPVFETRIQTFGTDETSSAVVKTASSVQDTATGAKSDIFIGTPAPTVPYTLVLPGPYDYVVVLDATGSFTGPGTATTTTTSTIAVDVGITKTLPTTSTDIKSYDSHAFAATKTVNVSESIGQFAAYPHASAHALVQRVVHHGSYYFGATYTTTLSSALTAIASFTAQAFALPIVPVCASICNSLPSVPYPYGRETSVALTTGTVYVSSNAITQPAWFDDAGAFGLPLVLQGAPAFIVSIDLLSATNETGNSATWTFTNTVAVQTEDVAYLAGGPKVVASAVNSNGTAATPESVVASVVTTVSPGTYYAVGLVASTATGTPAAATATLRLLVTPAY